jgi:hypothetical protein
MKSPELIDRLERIYHLPEWAMICELRRGTGIGSEAEGRADAVAFNCYPSSGLIRLAFEIKISRSDWLRELKDPGKRSWLERHFHECWLVAPDGIARESEIPTDWGWMIPNGDGLKRRVVARSRTPDPMPEMMIASCLRAVCGQLREYRSRHYTLGPTVGGEVVRVDQEQLDRIVDEATSLTRKHLDEDRAKLECEIEAIQRDRKRLQAPLAEMWRIGKESGWSFPSDVTASDVRQWLAVVEKRGAQSLLAQAQALRSQLDEFLQCRVGSGPSRP